MGDGVPGGNTGAFVEVVPAGDVVVLVGLEMKAVGAGKATLGCQNVIGSGGPVGGNKLGQEVSEGVRVANRSIGTAGRGSGKAEVGTIRGDLQHGVAILEGAIAVDGLVELQDGIQGGGQVADGAGREGEGTSGLGTGESAPLPEAGEGSVELAAVGAVADTDPEGVLEGRFINIRGVLAGRYEGGKKTEAGEVLCWELTVAMEGVFEVT